MSELLPCPFCGSTDVLAWTTYVICSDCNANGPPCPDDLNEVSAAWNRRAMQANQQNPGTKDRSMPTTDADLKRAKILESLAPLFAEARSKGLWFHGYYQDLWFSPDELAARHAQGRFIWGAANWELRDPGEKLKRLDADAKAAQRAHDEFAANLGRSGERKEG